jgi:arylformamidase
MRMIYDITRTIHPKTHVWEGDTSYSVQPLLQMSQGHSVNLVTLNMSAHSGSHADAYFHYEAHGAHPAQMPLEAYIGRTKVVSVDKKHGSLMPADFAHVDLVGGERLLIHSWVSELDDTEWAQEIPTLSVTLIAHLASLGYRLIGTDAPSVDPYDSKTLEAHHALYHYGMVNLEHITLKAVPDGDYELVALPLKLDLACASPVRAILRPLNR